MTLKNSTFFLAIMLMFLLSACSAFCPSREMVTITTEPKGSSIIVNGIKYDGTNSILVQISTGEDAIIQVYSADYPTRYYVLRRELTTQGVLDCIGSVAIIPAFGLLFDGSHRFVENNVTINLNDKNTNVECMTDSIKANTQLDSIQKKN